MSKKYDNLKGVHNEVNDELKSKGFNIDHRLSPRRYVLTKNNKDIYTFKTLKYLDLVVRITKINWEDHNENA